nr:MAG TPA: hypothetical protein [Caudoviricetes sp.]
MFHITNKSCNTKPVNYLFLCFILFSLFIPISVIAYRYFFTINTTFKKYI